jgi:hypothetical protein
LLHLQAFGGVASNPYSPIASLGGMLSKGLFKKDIKKDIDFWLVRASAEAREFVTGDGLLSDVL